MGFLVPLAIVLALLCTSAFFSAGELALMKLDALYLETELRRGTRLARLQERLRRRPQRLLSTILIGYNVANIALATYSAALALRWLGPRVGEQQALAASAVVMSVLIIIFAELMPKTVAVLSTPATARFVTYPLFIFDLVLTPLNWAIELLLTPLLRLLGAGKAVARAVVSREELATALLLAIRGGHVREADAAVAREALRFSRKDLTDVMTPRVDVVAAAEDATIGEALTLMINTGFSRLPLYHVSLDEVLGVLMLKDLVRESLRAAHGGMDPQDRWALAPAAPLKREVAHFPQTKSILEAFAEMSQMRVHLAVVVDEHGGTAGVVTLEDILEELVGDIRDETDHEHSADVIRRGEGYVIVTGRARVDALAELEGVALGESEATTVGGLMMERLGRPAAAGDVIAVDGVRITALKVLRHGIKLLRIDRPAG
jgi:putative hemolysin